MVVSKIAMLVIDVAEGRLASYKTKAYASISEENLKRCILHAFYLNSQHPDSVDHSAEPDNEGITWFDSVAAEVFTNAMAEILRLCLAKTLRVRRINDFEANLRGALFAMII